MSGRRRSMVGAAALAGAALLAGCGGHSGPATIETLDPNNLPKLPEQGLLVARRGGVLLVGTDGRVYGRLAGFSPFPGKRAGSGKRFAQSVGIEALQQADPALAIVFDEVGRGWLFDAPARRLRRLDPIEIGLAGRSRLVVEVSGNGTTGVDTKLSVRRVGSTLLSGDLSVLGSRYVASGNLASEKPGLILDLVTGARWKLPRRCTAAGVSGGRALAACATPGDGSASSRVLSFAPNGARRTLTAFTTGLYPESASLSPDGRWLLLYLAPGCGPGWTAVLKSSGGRARFVTNDGLVRSTGSLPTGRFSFGLGWTTDNRIVADFAAPKPSDCEHESGSGTFVIDPGTLARTRAFGSRAFALWGAATARRSASWSSTS